MSPLFILIALQRFKREAPLWPWRYKGRRLHLSATWLHNTFNWGSTLNWPLKRVFVRAYSSHMVIKVSAVNSSGLSALEICYLIMPFGSWIYSDVFPRYIIVTHSLWLKTIKKIPINFFKQCGWLQCKEVFVRQVLFLNVVADNNNNTPPNCQEGVKCAESEYVSCLM